MDTSEFLKREIAQDYQLVDKHGDGGCSIVYEAYRYSDDKHVAIKVLYLPESLEPDEAELTKQRFCVEAMIMRTLHHENIVECVDYGALEGSPCIILEFIEGKQLDEYLHEFGGVPFEYACNIVRQLLLALDAAHTKGIIHRDVKPANIMIIQEGNKPKVRLFDFGISTMTEMPMVRTKNGVIRGTPSYMAPELFSGETRATVESDLYAAGLILLECITGQVCVAGVTVMEIAFKQAHEDIQIPSFIPKCLADVILKCCDKNPEKRYHSASEMIEALDKALPEAIKQRDACEFEYLEEIKNGGVKKKSKTPIIIGLVAALVAVALGVGIFVGGQKSEPPAAPPAPVPAANAAEAANAAAPAPAPAPAPAAPAPAAVAPTPVPPPPVVAAPPAQPAAPAVPAPTPTPAVAEVPPAQPAQPAPDANPQPAPVADAAPTPADKEPEPAAKPAEDKPAPAAAEHKPAPKPAPKKQDSKDKDKKSKPDPVQESKPAAPAKKDSKSNKDTTIIPTGLI